MFVLSIKTFLFRCQRAVYCLAHVAEKNDWTGDANFALQGPWAGGAPGWGSAPHRAPLASRPLGRAPSRIKTAICKQECPHAPRARRLEMKIEAASTTHLQEDATSQIPFGRKLDCRNKKYV